MAPTDEFSDLPLLLTVEEVARLFRLGRSTAYERVNLYLDTAGVPGIPAIRIGSSIRAPRWALIEWVTTGCCPGMGERPAESSLATPRLVLNRLTTDLLISAGAGDASPRPGTDVVGGARGMLLASEPARRPASTRACALSVRDLARRLGLDKDTVARAVQRLVDAGHVAAIPDPHRPPGPSPASPTPSTFPTASTSSTTASPPTFQPTLAAPAPLTSPTNSTDHHHSPLDLPVTHRPTRPSRSTSPTSPSSQLSFLEL